MCVVAQVTVWFAVIQVRIPPSAGFFSSSFLCPCHLKLLASFSLPILWLNGILEQIWSFWSYLHNQITSHICHCYFNANKDFECTQKSLEQICCAPSFSHKVLQVVVLVADAGKSTIGGQLMYLTGMVDKRTLEKYEREAKEKNRETWYLSWCMDTNQEGQWLRSGPSTKRNVCYNWSNLRSHS